MQRVERTPLLDAIPCIFASQHCRHACHQTTHGNLSQMQRTVPGLTLSHLQFERDSIKPVYPSSRSLFRSSLAVAKVRCPALHCPALPGVPSFQTSAGVTLFPSADALMHDLAHSACGTGPLDSGHRWPTALPCLWPDGKPYGKSLASSLCLSCRPVRSNFDVTLRSISLSVLHCTAVIDIARSLRCRHKMETFSTLHCLLTIR